MNAAAGLDSPRLAAIATRPRRHRDGNAGDAPPPAAEERCDLCGEPLGHRHGHLVDLRERSLRCVCRACVILFDRDGAGGERFRLVPQRVRAIEDFTLTELDWVTMRIPVDLAFLFFSSAAERIVALYPGPMGATESRLDLGAWERMVGHNPVLGTIEPDVEALLVNRTGGARQGYIVPIDTCYELVGLFRTHWHGLSGGAAVWSAAADFFAELRARAEPATAAAGR